MLTMYRTYLTAVISVVFSVFVMIMTSSCAFGNTSASTPTPIDTTLHFFMLSSPDFKDGEALPATSEHDGGACKGENIAPTFSWTNVPAKTSSLALVMNDPDAPVAGTLHHWVVYNIPANVSTLKGNAPYTEGTGSPNNRTYFGPCPPATGQPHHYVFTLYALNIPNVQANGLTYDGLMQAIRGHVVGATTMIGTFRSVPGSN